MASSVPGWSAAELPRKVQTGADGRRRKLPGGRRRVDLLNDCELLTILQYDCAVESPRTEDSRVHCWPVPRLFRRCQDLKGKFMVETTAWEGFEGCPAGTAATATETAPAERAATAPAKVRPKPEELKERRGGLEGS